MGNNRRRVLAFAGAALALATLPIRAQGAMPRVGVLLGGSSETADSRRFVREFTEGMRALGYEDRRNYLLDVRYYGNDRGRIAVLADQLIANRAEVLVANVSSTASILRDRTETVPIVMATSLDPVGDGLAATLARPGGNITGMLTASPDHHARLIELSHTLLPKAQRVAFAVNPRNALAKADDQVASAAAKSAGLHYVRIDVRTPLDADRLGDELSRAEADALVVAGDRQLFDLRERIVRSGMRAGVPTIAVLPQFANRGALATFGPDVGANYRGIARYVERLLKGAKAADLPIEAPSQFELVVNLRTAKALRLTIPKEVLLRADRVIE